MFQSSTQSTIHLCEPQVLETMWSNVEQLSKIAASSASMKGSRVACFRAIQFQFDRSSPFSNVCCRPKPNPNMLPSSLYNSSKCRSSAGEYEFAQKQKQNRCVCFALESSKLSITEAPLYSLILVKLGFYFPFYILLCTFYPFYVLHTTLPILSVLLSYTSLKWCFPYVIRMEEVWNREMIFWDVALLLPFSTYPNTTFAHISLYSRGSTSMLCIEWGAKVVPIDTFNLRNWFAIQPRGLHLVKVTWVKVLWVFSQSWRGRSYDSHLGWWRRSYDSHLGWWGRSNVIWG